MKNVSYQGYTAQIKDFVLYCKTNDYKFILIIRQLSTKISTPLDNAIKDISGEIIRIIP